MEGRSIQRFEVLAELGRGGMGAVYRARDPQLEREVAIKVLARSAAATGLSMYETIDLRDSASERDELLAEARMMARLSHPNVLPIYEVGLDGDAVFLVMEYVAGTNLRKWLAEPRTRDEITAVLALAARGLAAAHARGIIHRDFKPDNVLLGVDGRVYVCDFGISGLIATPRPSRPSFQGTPKYMAPELFAGGEATVASDVFALCRTIAQAFRVTQDPRELRTRDLPPELAELVIAGLADDPAARPGLVPLLVALERRAPTAPPRRRPWLPIGAAIVAITAFVLVKAVFPARSPAACTADRSLLAGRWDAARAEALRTALVHAPADAEPVRRIAAIFDREADDLVAARTATCEARRRGELAVAQEVTRVACLARRAFELGGAVHRQLDRTGTDFPERERIATWSFTPIDCTELTIPPMRADAARVADLYDRFEVGLNLSGAQAIAQEQAIESEAEQLGEPELQARAGANLGFDLRDAQQLRDSDDVLERAYKVGVAIHSAHVQALALFDRSLTASAAGDTANAESLAKLAAAAADSPTVPPILRAQIFGQLGHAEKIRSEIAKALPHLDQALAELANAKLDEPALEIVFRTNKVDALLATDNGLAAGVQLARDTADYARKVSGEDSADYANAAHELAYALEVADDTEGALVYRHQTLAVLTRMYGADHQAVVSERSSIASDLLALGQIEQARAELAELSELIENTPALAPMRPSVLESLGTATFDAGRYDAGVRILQRALDESISQFGKDQLETLEARQVLAADLAELERYDEVRQHLAALEAGYRSHPEPMDRRLAILHGTLGADLATSRGDASAGQALAERANQELVELHEPDGSREWVLYELGRSLVAQHQFAPARAPLEEARAISDRERDRADSGAVIDIELARVELATGHHAKGLALARGARDVLAKFPGQRRARAEVKALAR